MMSSFNPVTGSAPTVDERNLAALSHASILLNFFMPGLGIIGALIVYATQKDRSSFVTRQSLQATVYQLLLAVVPIILLLIGMIVFVPLVVIASLASETAGAIVAVVGLVGLVLLGVAEFVGFIYALVGTYETYHGRNFHYPVVGSMMDRT
jgi:uncharacterized Tic20 family protein